MTRCSKHDLLGCYDCDHPVQNGSRPQETRVTGHSSPAELVAGEVYRTKRQIESQLWATRYREPWEVTEDELALSLPLRVAAERLGRTYFAVQSRRHVLRETS